MMSAVSMISSEIVQLVSSKILDYTHNSNILLQLTQNGNFSAGMEGKEKELSRTIDVSVRWQDWECEKDIKVVHLTFLILKSAFCPTRIMAQQRKPFCFI